MMTEEQAKSLLLKQENVYTRDPQLREPAFAYCEGYKAFLDIAKTEREASRRDREDGEGARIR